MTYQPADKAAGGAASLPLSGGSGELPIRIARDGTWFYRDSPIQRKELVKLFSTVLRLDGDGRYWLKTPVEQGVIEVEDVPFTAVELEAEGAGRDMALRFRDNFDDWVTADVDHPIRVVQDPETGQPSPYIRIRDNLDALILRPVFYELVEIATPVERNGRTVLGVWSAGEFFELGEE
ncbi:MAG: DUF1285 domain-containing protein [Pseudomonadota bacterium]